MIPPATCDKPSIVCPCTAEPSVVWLCLRLPTRQRCCCPITRCVVRSLPSLASYPKPHVTPSLEVPLRASPACACLVLLGDIRDVAPDDVDWWGLSFCFKSSPCSSKFHASCCPTQNPVRLALVLGTYTWECMTRRARCGVGLTHYWRGASIEMPACGPTSASVSACESLGASREALEPSIHGSPSKIAKRPPASVFPYCSTYCPSNTHKHFP